MTNTFEMNGNGYRTDKETVEVIRELIAKKAFQCVCAVMALGLKTGRIVVIANV